MNNSLKYIGFSYVVIFSTFIVWVFASTYIFQSKLDLSHKYASIINISGMQRMLSQRSALYTQILLNEKEKDSFHQLEITLRKFEQNHHFLLQQLNDNSELYTVYFTGKNCIDSLSTQYINKLKTFEKVQSKILQEEIFDLSQKLLPKLDHAVFLFQKESEKIIQDIKEFELVLYIRGPLKTSFRTSSFLFS